MDLAELIVAAEAEGQTARPRLERVLRLVESTRALAAEIDAARIVELITNQSRDALRCDRSEVYHFDAKRQELNAQLAATTTTVPVRCAMRQGVPGCVAHERVIVNIPEPSIDYRWDAQFDGLTGYCTRGILAVPLIAPSDDALLGVLQLLNKLEGAFDEFDERLLEAFGRHASAALDRSRLIAQVQRQRENELALKIAREIQLSFTPSALPDVPGYEMATWWTPNEAVGGDYCDVMPLTDKHIGLVIADVSGHGLGPSLIMSSARAALRALVLEHVCPQALLELLAKALATDLQPGHFITMLMASLDTGCHVLEFANAGHAPAEHYRPATDCFTSLASTGMPLGVANDATYPLGPQLPINCGDIVILCTDGIVEALDADDRPFGISRLREVIRQCRGGSMHELVSCVATAVQQHFVGDAASDDLTILAVRRNA
jgi:serine phosphatase RsbU (regulator of sigma subunit)